MAAAGLPPARWWADPPKAQTPRGGCDKLRVKTKKKEKQNDFLTDTCHSRLGVPRSSCSKSTSATGPPRWDRLSIRFAKRLLQLRAEGSLRLCGDLQYEMQGQTVHLDGGRKGVHPFHDFEALHDLD